MKPISTIPSAEEETTDAGWSITVPRVLTLLVLVISIAATALILSLPPTSVNVNAVYRNF
jgi:hypothetical protein